MKTKKNEELDIPVQISKTRQLIRKSLKVSKGAYYGATSHFQVDQNTAETLLRAIWVYSIYGDVSKLLKQIDIQKENLYLINPLDKIKNK